jgi:hypothetical protein
LTFKVKQKAELCAFEQAAAQFYKLRRRKQFPSVKRNHSMYNMNISKSEATMQNSLLIGLTFIQSYLKKEIATPLGIADGKIQVGFIQTLKL